MKKILLRALLVIGGAIGLYIVFFPLIYGLTARIISSSVTGDFVPPVILAPEPPREGDETMADVFTIAGAVEWEDDDACGHESDQRDAEACRALVERHSDVIERLRAWAEDPGPLGPRQRDAAGRHARAPVAVGMMFEIPPLMPQLRLADLLAIAAEQAFVDGDREAGERALRLMFDLGAYFEHNPSTLIHEMIGVALTNKAVLTVARVVPAESAAAVVVWLPEETERLLSLQLSLGGEWLNLGYFLDHELRSNNPFAVAGSEADSSVVSWGMIEAAGMYDPVHTRQMHDTFWCRVQDATRAPPLMRVELDMDTWETMGVVKYFHNPVGRMLFSIAVPGYARYGARVGSSADRVAAVRVVLAARLFHASEGRWPGSEEELGFAWPRSVLNEKSLHWDHEANAIVLFSEEEGGLCADESECVLHFAPALD